MQVETFQGYAHRTSPASSDRPCLFVGSSLSARGFFPRLKVLPGWPRWSGFLYAQLQARLQQSCRTHVRRPARPGGSAVRAAVLGASGVIGRALVPALAREHEVVAVSRNPRDASHGRVRWVAADATRRSELGPAFRGVDVVYHLVHSLGAKDFEERDRMAAESVAAAANLAGVRQIVFLGGLGDDREDLSPHLRSRAETARCLASGPVPVTTVRSAVVVGGGSTAFETIVALVHRLPVMICPRWVATKTQPIALDDVVRYLAGVGGRDEALGEAYDAAGPEVMSYREMIERVARLLGRRPLIVEVPFLTPHLSSLWLHLVTPVKVGVARPLVDGLRNETVAHDERIRALVPFEFTSFDEAARAALAREGPDWPTA
jgi:uncharacterized protein YbjT (DUF2867 family)